MAIHRVPPQCVEAVWPAVEDYAARACRHHPFMDAEDLLVVLREGRGQLVVATDARGIEGFALVEVIRFPKIATGNIVAAGGRRGFLKTLREEMLPELEQWSAEHGATAFSVTGRVGWRRFAKPHGFAIVPVVTAWRAIDGRRRRITDHKD